MKALVVNCTLKASGEEPLVVAQALAKKPDGGSAWVIGGT